MRLVSAIYPTFYPFDEMRLFDDHVTTKDPDTLREGDCLVVWGGSDISPTIYGKKVSAHTGADAKLSGRDIIEWDLMKRCQQMMLPIIGICRGAQMLCGLAGGTLVQDVTGHTRSHGVCCKDGELFTASSLHHQMLNPFDKTDHVLIAKSTFEMSTRYLDVDDDGNEVEAEGMECEPEFVWFPAEKGVAIQWHPEFMDMKSNANAYVHRKVKELLF